VGGRTVKIHIVCTFRTIIHIWHENRGISGTIFEADFRIFVVVYGSYRIVRTTKYGHEKRGIEEFVQQYDFDTKNKANFCGSELVL
jgi:hypothetical protein